MSSLAAVPVRDLNMRLLCYRHRHQIADWYMPGSDVFTASPGTYVLLLDLQGPRTIPVGALGCQRFEPGVYLYVGSARGPGGLRARIAHHQRVTDRPHWHIDYLRRHARITMVWVSTDSARLECRWHAMLAGLEALDSGMPGFGASDCRCRTHLLRAPSFGSGLIRSVSERLHPAVPQQVCWP